MSAEPTARLPRDDFVQATIAGPILASASWMPVRHAGQLSDNHDERALPVKISGDWALRRELRRRRTDLRRSYRQVASREILRRARRLLRFGRARRVAAYVGANAEVDPMPLLAAASHSGKQCYLPVLHPYRPGRLLFRRWRPGQRMRINRYRIPEPIPGSSALLPAKHLDLVLVPLLGFDQHGGRLGMGGGYYDRTFAFRRLRQGPARPLLVGLAFATQQVASVPQRAWDVPLDMVITEKADVLPDGRY